MFLTYFFAVFLWVDLALNCDLRRFHWRNTTQGHRIRPLCLLHDLCALYDLYFLYDLYDLCDLCDMYYCIKYHTLHPTVRSKISSKLIFRRNSSYLQAVCDTPIARITGCVSSLRM